MYTKALEKSIKRDSMITSLTASIMGCPQFCIREQWLNLVRFEQKPECTLHNNLFHSKKEGISR